MEVSKLKVDDRFVFVDTNTSLPLVGPDPVMQFPPKGVFKFLGTCQYGWVILFHEESGKRIIVITGVNLRHVYPIF